MFAMFGNLKPVCIIKDSSVAFLDKQLDDINEEWKKKTEELDEEYQKKKEEVVAKIKTEVGLNQDVDIMIAYGVLYKQVEND